MRPDQDGEQQGDDGIKEQPAATTYVPDAEPHDQLEDCLDEQIDAEDCRKCKKAGNRMGEQIDANRDVDNADQQLPDEAARPTKMPREHEVGYAAENQQPAEH